MTRCLGAFVPIEMRGGFERSIQNYIGEEVSRLNGVGDYTILEIPLVLKAIGNPMLNPTKEQHHKSKCNHRLQDSSVYLVSDGSKVKLEALEFIITVMKLN